MRKLIVKSSLMNNSNKNYVSLKTEKIVKRGLPQSATRSSENSTKNENASPPTHVLTKSLSEGVEFFDKLENRFRPHLNFLAEKQLTILCKSCCKEMPKLIGCIKDHILSPSHCTLTNLPNFKRTYYCSVCKNTWSKEKRWIVHLKSPLHNAKMIGLDEKTRNEIAEYECSCGTVVFGDEAIVRHHKQTRPRKIEPFRLHNVAIEMMKSDAILKAEVNKLVDESQALLKLNNKMLKCCEEISNAARDVFPDCRAYPFGSRVTGLGNTESDLDVFLDIGDMYCGRHFQDAFSQKKILKKVRDVFYKKRNIFADIHSIATARTPIIQVFHIPSDIDCDISFKNGLSVENTRFIKLCIDMEGCTRPLILFLKKWSKLHKLNTNITTYALSMMVIFYLQSKEYLLPVTMLKQLNSPSELIQDWEAIDYIMSLEAMKTRVKQNTATIQESLIGLFKFYANFDFKTDVVCPLLGKVVKKIDFLPDGSALPEEMDTYKRKLSWPNAEIFRATSEMCVQDPFDLSHNLTKACQKSVVIKLKALCDLTANHLSGLQ